MTERLCRNCHSPLKGEYCYHCGQREGRPDLLFSDAVGEAVGDLFTWDSRFWRTLFPLLLRPGYLTAEFIAGRRARYVPPFRLYLIISFFLFLTLSLTTGGSLGITVGTDGTTGVEGGGVALIGAGDDDSAVDRSDTESQATNIDLGFDPNDPTLPAWLAGLGKRAEINAERIAGDPGILLQNLLDYLPQLMFIMLPVFALLLRAVYAFSPFHYLQHLVFVLHYHSFVYLLYLLSGLLALLDIDADRFLVLALLLYLPLALRGAYRSSWPGAVAKALVLQGTYIVLLLLGFIVLLLLVVAFL